MAGETLEQLEEQRLQLQAELAEVKKTIEEQRDRINMLVGAAVLAEANANPAYKAKLTKILDKLVKGRRNRSMLGLEGRGPSKGDHRVTGD